MRGNASLNRAKRKHNNDEWYTPIELIEEELAHYTAQFAGKVVLCNCDDPTESNFPRYFLRHFNRLKLKKLICTSYAGSETGTGHVMEVSEVPGDPDALVSDAVIDDMLHKDGIIKRLHGSGAFQSPECVEYLKECDICCTNPPFSQFRDLFALLVKYHKQYLLIGNMNALTCKDIFPYIKGNKAWLGYRFGHMTFRAPHDTPPQNTHCWIDQDGQMWRSIGNGMWLTNLFVKNRCDGIWHKDGKLDNSQALKYYEGAEHLYPKYHNYDAIEVSKTKDIPIDYSGVIGVPISWLGKYNPEEFEVLGCTQRGCHDAFPDTKKYDDYWEVRQDGTKTGSSGSKTNENAIIARNDGKHNYFKNKDGHEVQSTYSRIFIRNRNPIKRTHDTIRKDETTA